MLERKITEEFLKWKKEKNKPCLLVKGARQVGKTFIIEDFAKNNYKSYIYINFELMPEYKNIFNGNLDIKTLIMKLELAFPDISIIPNDTILFLDEIQACPNARVSLKSFALDGRIDVIASGSLLGLHYKEVRSYPVGYERTINMYPMDFEEFLWALGVKKDIIANLRDSFNRKIAVDDYINKETMILTIIGILFGLVFGIFLTNIIIDTVEIEMVRFIRHINIVSFIISSLITIIFTVIVIIITHYSLKKIDMIESLKSVE